MVGGFLTPHGQDSGEASRFPYEIEQTRMALYGKYKAPPLANVRLDTGEHFVIRSFDDIGDDFLDRDLLSLMWSQARDLATEIGRGIDVDIYESEPFTMTYGLDRDGVLRLEFADGSYLVHPSVPKARSAVGRQQVTSSKDGSDTWGVAVASHRIHEQIEAVVSLAQKTELVDQLAPAEQPVAEAALTLLSNLSRTESPPRELVRPALIWLGEKVDRFVDAATSAGGTAVGVAGAGALATHMPGLSQLIQKLLAIAN